MTFLIKSRRDVDALNLRPEDLDIRDIAHNLSMICRFTGAYPFHYSVAQHSILVSERIGARNYSSQMQLAGLLHDAAEYVFNDIASPIKHSPMMAGYRKLEHETSEMILRHFDCHPEHLALIKPFDEEVYQMEVRVRDGLSKAIMELSPKTVYNAFLATFYRLNT